MKIAIISDTHDNVPNLEKFLAWAKENKIKQIIFCGDLCAPSMLAEVLGPKFSGPIYMVFGNVEDRDLLPKRVAEFKNVKHFGDEGRINIDGKKIAFTHHPEPARKLAESGEYDYVFYGHTHKPWEETVGTTQLVNPGTLAGMFSKATFAVLETKIGELELKLVEQL